MGFQFPPRPSITSTIDYPVLTTVDEIFTTTVMGSAITVMQWVLNYLLLRSYWTFGLVSAWKEVGPQAVLVDQLCRAYSDDLSHHRWHHWIHLATTQRGYNVNLASNHLQAYARRDSVCRGFFASH